MSHDHPHDPDHGHAHDEPRWKHDGIRVIKGDALDSNTPQTPGMFRQAAINAARVGAQKIWAGTVTIHAKAKTGAHHHGALESVIYVLRGKARMRWGENLEFIAEAGGDAEILSAEIDLARSEHVRRIWPFLRDRRIDAYGDLTKRFRD